jgi:putative FmdB family regulatory protein
MPLYEYECDVCGRRFEAIQKFSDPPLEVCPSCGGSVHKLQSAPAFQFKGSGWYITDYARKDDKSATTTEKPEAGKETGKDAAKDGGKTGETAAQSSDKASSESKPKKSDAASGSAPSTPTT